MNIHIYRSKKTGDETISFPKLQCWNPLTKVATIAAQYMGRRVSCRVQIRDLKKKFHYFPDQPMDLVTNYRDRIETAARKLIERKEFQEDGSIKINYKDL